MRKSKGFTLVELLAVIVILGVIATIVVVSVNNNLKNSRNTITSVQKEMVIDSTKNWVVDNVDSFPESGNVYITLGQLKQGGYISEEIKIADSDKCLSYNTPIIITKTGKNYDYKLSEEKKYYVGCSSNEVSNKPSIVLPTKDSIIKNELVITTVEIGSSVSLSYDLYNSNGEKCNSELSNCPNIEVEVDINDTISNDTKNLTVSNIGINYLITYTVTETFEDGMKSTVIAKRQLVGKDTIPPVITLSTNNYNVYYIDENENGEYDSGDTLGNPNWCKELNSIISVSDNSGEYNFKYKDLECTNVKDSVIIDVVASDKSNNQSKETFKVNLQKIKVEGPMVDVSPSGSANWLSDNKLSVTISHPTSDINSLKYSVNGGSSFSSNLISSSCTKLSGVSGYQYNCSVEIPDGNYASRDVVIRASIDSVVGEKNTDYVLNAIKIDSTKPILSATVKDINDTLVNNNSWSKNNLKATISVNNSSELESGYKIYYCIDSNNSCVPNIEYESLINYSAEGNNYLRYMAKSGSGIESDINSATLNIDRTPPVFFINVTDGTTWKKENKFIIKLSDNYSGLKAGTYNIKYYIGDSEPNWENVDTSVSLNVSNSGASEVSSNEITINSGDSRKVFANISYVSDAVGNSYSKVIDTDMYIDNTSPDVSNDTDYPKKVWKNTKYVYIAGRGRTDDGDNVPPQIAEISVLCDGVTTVADAKKYVSSVYNNYYNGSAWKTTKELANTHDGNTSNYTSIGNSTDNLLKVTLNATKDTCSSVTVYSNKASSSKVTYHKYSLVDFTTTSSSGSGSSFKSGLNNIKSGSYTTYSNTSFKNKSNDWTFNNVNVYDHSIVATDNYSGIKSIKYGSTTKTYSCTSSEVVTVKQQSSSLAFTVTDCAGNVTTFTSVYEN